VHELVLVHATLQRRVLLGCDRRNMSRGDDDCSLRRDRRVCRLRDSVSYRADQRSVRVQHVEPVHDYGGVQLQRRTTDPADPSERVEKLGPGCRGVRMSAACASDLPIQPT
jgi:hypothetical protein